MLPEDGYLREFIAALALDHALRAGVIEAAGQGGWRDITPGSLILRGLLQGAGVLEGDYLSPAFAEMLSERRDILEQKLAFLKIAAADLLFGATDLFTDLPRFRARAGTFGLFRYDLAMTTAPDHLAATRKWVAYVEALSRAEIPVLAPVVAAGLVGARRLVEVGGNTGLFAEALVALVPGLQAVVMDLPAVCALGQARTGGVAFVAGDARRDPWPQVAQRSPDAVLFKSVLHDWQADEMVGFLARAHAHLAPGGRVVIAERSNLPPGPAAFSMVANLVFAPFYRPPELYLAALEQAGFGPASLRWVEVEMPFMVLTARKAGG